MRFFVSHFTGHYHKVNIIRYHPTADGLLSSGSYDLTVKLWDINAMNAFITLEEHPQSVNWILYDYHNFLSTLRVLHQSNQDFKTYRTIKDKYYRNLIVPPVHVTFLDGAHGSCQQLRI